ncbi:hypothetical protein PIROE2DRAFT_15040 [Piromyces sp. E2]|nr:hypothetical protein PIROE2DRAFT_15040 [Piromyces sp. E2]|eukprot:OUM59437.1 hypothetical protein PIROE2DRAFT_15040 [Piromyces sp. E2]
MKKKILYISLGTTEFLQKNVNETGKVNNIMMNNKKSFNELIKALKNYVQKQEKVRSQTLKLIKALKNCSTQVPSTSKQYIEALSNALTLTEYYIKISDDRINQRICKTLEFFSSVTYPIINIKY